jgi:MoaA/NifB/PqqE/SkfB family radical SAM enzyme
MRPLLRRRRAGQGLRPHDTRDWEHVLTQAAGLGCRHVTFIGGEPTMHPELARLARHAVALGMNAEIYTNLVHITPAMWELFQTPGVSLAASWYTSDRDQHKAITGGHDSTGRLRRTSRKRRGGESRSARAR